MANNNVFKVPVGGAKPLGVTLRPRPVVATTVVATEETKDRRENVEVAQERAIVTNVRPVVKTRDEVLVPHHDDEEDQDEVNEVKFNLPPQAQAPANIKKAANPVMFRIPTRSPISDKGKGKQKTAATQCPAACSTPAGKFRAVNEKNPAMGCRDFSGPNHCDFMGCKMCMKTYKNCKTCGRSLNLAEHYSAAVLATVYKNNVSKSDVVKECCVAFENAIPQGYKDHHVQTVLPLFEESCKLSIQRAQHINQKGYGFPFPDSLVKETKKNKLALAKEQTYLRKWAKDSSGFSLNVTCKGCKALLFREKEESDWICPSDPQCGVVCQTCFAPHAAKARCVENFICVCGLVSEKHGASVYIFCIGCSQFFDMKGDTPEVFKTPHFNYGLAENPNSKKFSASLRYNIKMLQETYSKFFETNRKKLLISLKTVRVSNINSCSIDIDNLNKKMIDLFAMLKKISDIMHTLYDFLVFGQNATEDEINLTVQKINKMGVTKTKSTNYIMDNFMFSEPKEKKIGVSGLIEGDTQTDADVEHDAEDELAEHDAEDELAAEDELPENQDNQ